MVAELSGILDDNFMKEDHGECQILVNQYIYLNSLNFIGNYLCNCGFILIYNVSIIFNSDSQAKGSSELY